MAVDLLNPLPYLNFSQYLHPAHLAAQTKAYAGIYSTFVANIVSNGLVHADAQAPAQSQLAASSSSITSATYDDDPLQPKKQRKTTKTEKKAAEPTLHDDYKESIDESLPVRNLKPTETYPMKTGNGDENMVGPLLRIGCNVMKRSSPLSPCTWNSAVTANLSHLEMRDCETPK